MKGDKADICIDFHAEEIIPEVNYLQDSNSYVLRIKDKNSGYNGVNFYVKTSRNLDVFLGWLKVEIERAKSKGGERDGKDGAN